MIFKGKKPWRILINAWAVPGAAIVLATLIWSWNATDEPILVLDESGPQQVAPADLSTLNQKKKESLFSSNFPVNKKFQKELEDMRVARKLEEQNELLINQMITKTTNELSMPPAVLWCLLFQESRLNHLTGIDKRGGARGLGQFSRYGFMEINKQLNHFKADNLRMFVHTLGSDVRPITAMADRPYHPSSYYNIPTAVAASAAHLNNRYHQLKRNLDRKNIEYDEEILWLYAIMAYNKGTRSVMTFLNQARKLGGTPYVSRLVTDEEELFENLRTSNRFKRALLTIWEDHTATRYAKELTIHMRQISHCAVNRGMNPFRKLAYKKITLKKHENGTRKNK